MRFVYHLGSLQPADEVAAGHVARMQEGDELELVEVSETRTQKQNNSIWLYCTKLAGALDAAGYDMRTFPWKEGLSIPFTKKSVMEQFWRPTQDAMLGKESTKELTPKEVNVIYEAVDRALSTRVGVRAEFPSLQSQSLESQVRRVA